MCAALICCTLTCLPFFPTVPGLALPVPEAAAVPPVAAGLGLPVFIAASLCVARLFLPLPAPSLTVALAGAAVNVYYRDVGAALPVLLSLLMYASPVIYPLDLVKDKLLVQHAAGDQSNVLYIVYTLNPLAGIIDSFQNVVLRGLPPNFVALMPGAILVAIALPISYMVFKRAESYFADVI